MSKHMQEDASNVSELPRPSGLIASAQSNMLGADLNYQEVSNTDKESGHFEAVYMDVKPDEKK